MKLRIAIAGTRGIPNQYGGFEAFAAELSLRLVAHGHEVTVYNSHAHPYQENNWNGVHIRHCYDPEAVLGTAGQFIYDLNCIVHARSLKPDILLLLGYTSSSIWYPLFPASTKVICNMDGLEWKRSKYGKLVKSFLKFAERLAVRHSDALIADSPVIQQYLAEQYSMRVNYIPYAATIPQHIDDSALDKFNLRPGGYFILVARMEKENNIEMILDGYLRSDKKFPFIVVGNTSTPYGNLLRRKYHHSMIRFTEGIYDKRILESLVFHARLYFHGHSVGGTNPSLLEAMATGVPLAVHDNPFNAQVVAGQAAYFGNSNDVCVILNSKIDVHISEKRSRLNKQRIAADFSWDHITNAYETLFTDVLKKVSRQPAESGVRTYGEINGIEPATTYP